MDVLKILFIEKRKNGGIAVDPIIDKITQIETATARILYDAAAQTKAQDQAYEDKVADYDREADKITAEKLDRLKEELSVNRQKELQNLKTSAEQNLANLNHYYETNHEKLAAQIFESIIRK